MVATRLQPITQSVSMLVLVDCRPAFILVTMRGFTCMKKTHRNHFRLYLQRKSHKLDPNSHCLTYQDKHGAQLGVPQNEQ